VVLAGPRARAAKTIVQHMRLTGGTMRSRRVAAPKGRAVRPTPSRVKEALFSMLAPRLADARVLDLYAGSGALGFEAISRGAGHVTFVEASKPTAARIRQTGMDLGVADRVHVIAGDAARVVGRLHGRYDLVFADPPFAQVLPPGMLETLRGRGLVDRDSLVVYEHSARMPAAAPEGFTVAREAAYGSVALTFLQPCAGTSV